MNRRLFLASLLGALPLIAEGHTRLDFMCGKHRRRYRRSTEGSLKWKHGHCFGCVMYAPGHKCICAEILRECGGPLQRTQRGVLVKVSEPPSGESGIRILTASPACSSQYLIDYVEPAGEPREALRL